MLCPVPDDEGLHEPLVVPNFLARFEATKWMLVRVLHLARLRRWADGLGFLCDRRHPAEERVGSGGRRWGGWRR